MDNTNGHEKVTGPWGLAAFYVGKHGPVTFGLITVLLMWRVMVTPELERKALDTEVLRSLIEDMHSHNRDQQAISQHLKTTAEILDRITARQSNDNGKN